MAQRVKKLTPKEQLFVAEYLACLNGTKAAINSGYAPRSANVTACRMLTKAHINLAIAEGLRRLIDKPISEAERVIKEALVLAYSDIRKAFNDKGQLLDVKDLPDDLAGAVSSVEITERQTLSGAIEYTKKLRFWDKPSALTLLGKYHKILTEKLEVSGDVRVISLADARKMSPEQLADAAQDIARQAEELAKSIPRS